MIDIQLIYALMKLDEMLCRIIFILSAKNRKKFVHSEKEGTGLGKPGITAKLRGENL
jgi:hypothetical protein